MINLVWDKAHPMLQKCEDAMPVSEQVNPDVYKPALLKGYDQQLVLVVDGDECIGVAILLLTYEDNGDRILQINSLAGIRLHEWSLPFHETTRRIAEIENCTKIVTLAIRSGWHKVLGNFGYKEGLTPYTLDLGEQ